MIVQGFTAAAAFSPVRISEVEKLICIRLKLKYAFAVESRFTLHSVTGIRQHDGSMEIERIAGFCHLRNALKNYWADQIDTITDPDTKLEITDLAAWLRAGASKPADLGSMEMGADTPVALRQTTQQKRGLGHLLRTIERAILHAETTGLPEVADRLRGIRGTLSADVPPAIPAWAGIAADAKCGL
jgi:hypothetical protein